MRREQDNWSTIGRHRLSRTVFSVMIIFILKISIFRHHNFYSENKAQLRVYQTLDGRLIEVTTIEEPGLVGTAKRWPPPPPLNRGLISHSMLQLFRNFE